MARLDVNADEHRIRPGVNLLQARSELEAVGRHDAVVVVAGGDHRGRVGGLRLEVVVG